MAVWVLWSLVAALSRAFPPKAWARTLEDASAVLRQVRQRVLRGDPAPVTTGETRDGRRGALVALLREAQDEGLPMTESVAALETELGASSTDLASARRLWLVFATRALVGLGFAAACATALGLAAGDAPAAMLGAVIAVLGFLGLVRHLPRPWTLARAPGGGLSDEALAWSAHRLLDHGLGEIALPRGEEERLARLRQDELLDGVSLREERHGALREFAAGRRRLFATRLQRLEDLLPLIELAAIGLPVALVLSGPVRRWLASV
jgi:hypothetical protein